MKSIFRVLCSQLSVSTDQEDKEKAEKKEISHLEETNGENNIYYYTSLLYVSMHGHARAQCVLAGFPR